MPFHVLISDNVDKRAIALLQEKPDLRVTAGGDLSREQTIAALPEADALIIRSATKANAELLGYASKLKVIARAGVGVDNVDLNAATDKGIVVMNTPDGNTISTAEHTFGLMLSLARHIPQAHASLAGGAWDRKSFTGLELRDKTLGIVGFGRIGRAVAKRALAFEMNVISYDPFVLPDMAADMGVTMVSLDTLFAQSDFISLHTSVNDESRYMVDAKSIAKMKDGVRLINAARGVLIRDTDLADAIKSGKVAGAALDVFEPEPPATDNPLIGLPGVIHTPHLAASTKDAQNNVAIDAAQLVIDALMLGRYANVCNPAVLQTH
ncbi:MAG: phosphoglycerate dehydrogenase [Chloroflexi bacterium]|nr:phosphoglycerate dehydrogenase [Chloroflexota bacterium]